MYLLCPPLPSILTSLIVPLVEDAHLDSVSADDVLSRPSVRRHDVPPNERAESDVGVSRLRRQRPL